jgi:hypothetical protein
VVIHKKIYLKFGCKPYVKIEKYLNLFIFFLPITTCWKKISIFLKINWNLTNQGQCFAFFWYNKPYKNLKKSNLTSTSSIQSSHSILLLRMYIYVYRVQVDILIDWVPNLQLYQANLLQMHIELHATTIPNLQLPCDSMFGIKIIITLSHFIRLYN